MQPSQAYEHYHVPSKSYWPIVGSIGLITSVAGAANWIHGNTMGAAVMGVGLVIIFSMMFGWFGDVIRESRKGLYSKQMDHSFRWGMIWFIFSEVMFFAAFFGALFYARELALPWLAGEGARPDTGAVLWPNFKAVWPLLNNPSPEKFPGPTEVMGAWGLPAINTLILLTSGVTLTIAHWGLQKNQRKKLVGFLLATVLLGFAFLSLQALEYHHAYTELGLTLASGIYGSTFFMLTGFHGMHVTIGAIMLTVILIRCLRGHFTPGQHFGFEAVAWYWHFVDVVWLFLFIFVYWL